MSLGQRLVLKEELECQLKQTGLPKDPREVIGRLYQFDCEHGSHHHTLIGTIQAIQVSDEGGFELHVSSPLFWGRPIRSLTHSEQGWTMYIVQDEEGKRLGERSTFPGTFTFL